MKVAATLTKSIAITQNALDKTCRCTTNPNGTRRDWNFQVTDQWLDRVQKVRNRAMYAQI